MMDTLDIQNCTTERNFTSSLSLVSNMSGDFEHIEREMTRAEKKTSRPKKMFRSFISPFSYLKRSCFEKKELETSEISLDTPKPTVDEPCVSNLIVLGIDGLVRETNFTREELQRMYRGFKTECPSGFIDLETFLCIHSMLFPGSDPALYGNRLFNSFDKQKSGKLSFEGFVLALSRCLHGTYEDKLRWAFSLYDLDEDGFLDREDLQFILKGIFGLSKYVEEGDDENIIARVEKLFMSMDLNNDGKISEHEFVSCCLKNKQLLKTLCEYDEDDDIENTTFNQRHLSLSDDDYADASSSS
ncbi:frequenin-1-like [Hydractinia symbiolongicarpus]|uniref:frequenin-1-like n=1 Tax=Hydractinia symbiolongicarpus TaxID=13093 RepID=UPI00254AE73C|nr:frequenin-1-like [Hydractinia symbiolongicarpus]